jgi:hypothetical protein
MNTLAIRAGGVIASSVQSRPGQSFFQRLIAARENEAKRRVVGYLAAMDDARLEGIGFTADDIKALRSGQMRLPR